MKDSEKENVMDMYKHYDFSCFLCKSQATQRAHIIGNTLLNRKLYGRRIIDNPLNWLPACSLKHNKKIDIGRNSIIAKKIVSVIDSMDDYSDKQEQIEQVVMENIKAREAING